IMCSDVQKGRLTSARRFTGGAFVDQRLGDQLLHQYANYSTSHVHAARQIGAGNWLMLTDEIKGDVPVDVARSRARSNVEIPGIDLTHERPFRYCLRCEQ